ncbi:MAG TPA: ExeM/NucH family extracellular endonuclease, partial [Acidimicrobiia bacterium]|nr:ExeM/NucH family extracellular endonuclease [Acidimicrobiia bacterium]
PALVPPFISPDGTVRRGDTIDGLSGVLGYAFGAYEVHASPALTFTRVNERVGPPDVGGTLQVGAFNVLNYFPTIDTGAPICGPLADQGCRGADSAAEFTRQRDKIFAALAAMDADVVGLMEIENHATDAALKDLIAGLNAVVGAGTYDYIHTGPIGTDAIKVALIYKPGTVTPYMHVGVLDTLDFVDPNSTGEHQNRPAVLQSFSDVGSGEVFTVVVNHLKSKGSSCGAGDDDPEAASCNLTRTLAAKKLMDWLASDPTGVGDPDILIIGDLNSYEMEDPIDAIKVGADDIAGTSDDFVDLAMAFEGAMSYTYVFDGQLGSLDYALANGTLRSQIIGAAVWHNNTDEPDIVDYDTSFKKDAQDAIYAPDAYRSSDHDPVIVGLRLQTIDVGMFDPDLAHWYLADPNQKSTKAIPGSKLFTFGNPGDYPFMGDWDCDGVDTPGLYRQSDGLVYLRNSNTTGIADLQFFFGNPGDVPIAGDFDGDGCDTVSLFRPSETRMYVINALGEDGKGLGAAETDYLFGDPGDIPIAGDWDADGIDTLGVGRPSDGRIYLRNSHTNGIADLVFTFGDPGDIPFAGDWTQDGTDNVGVYRPSTKTFYLKFTNTPGAADMSMTWGEADWMPLAGGFGIIG